jgi:hypothetical protein
MSWRWLVWFLIAQLLAGALVFRDALWGRTLLAPLDILPAHFPHYRYLDPTSSGVPANYTLIDQVTYDLPLQYLVHQSWRRGEIPWWNPYTFGGRPLLADAHANAADPVRVLLDGLLPFEAAYNWTKVAHYFICGLGMLILLRRLGFKDIPALWLSLAYEFSGAFALFFGHPWIQGAFLYYPFLWLAWDHALNGKCWAVALAGLLIAAILCAGNLQSHSYLVVFALAYGFGHAANSRRNWMRGLLLLAGSAVLGAMLAAPVLGAELELYSHNVREVGAPFNTLGMLSGPGTIAAFYPWSLGTFRSLDLTRLFGQSWPLGFTPFIGCAAFVLALVGAASAGPAPAHAAARRTALGLVFAYLVIISTPLNNYLYMRCAALAAVGLTVLAAIGYARLLERGESWRRLAMTVLLAASGAALATHVFACFVFERLRPRTEEFVVRKAAQRRSYINAPALRREQVRRLPREITFRNPEAALGFTSLLAMAFFLRYPEWRRNRRICAGILLLNCLPVLLFSSRFIPRQSLTMWQRLQEGGPEQRRLATRLGDASLRLAETNQAFHEMVFPAELPALQRVHSLFGYAALKPSCLGTAPPAELSRWRASLEEWSDAGATGAICLARFRWRGPGSRGYSVQESGLNHLRISLQPGAAGTLLWFDTFYPGWRAIQDGQRVRLEPYGRWFGAMNLPASPWTTDIELQYEPTWLPGGRNAAMLGALILTALFGAHPALSWWVRRRARS